MNNEFPIMDKFEAQSVLADCDKGIQNCVNCPALKCCDNLSFQNIENLYKQLAEARLNAKVLAHAYDNDNMPPSTALQQARSYEVPNFFIIMKLTE